MIRTKAAAAALATAALLGAPLAVAHAGTVDSISVKDRKGDIDGNKKMRSAKSIDLSRVTYKHVEAGGEDHLVVQYKVRSAFGRKNGRLQAFATQSESFAFQSSFRPDGSVDVWSDEMEELTTCEGATEKIDRRRDMVTQRVPATCLGGVTEGDLSSVALVFALRGEKMALDFTRSRQFSWAPTVTG